MDSHHNQLESPSIKPVEFTYDKIKRIFTNRNLWYLAGIALGAVSITYFSQLLFKQVCSHFDNSVINSIARKDRKRRASPSQAEN